MTRVPLSIAVHPYDRVRGLLDGSIQVEGCDCTVVAIGAEEAFARAAAGEPFDVTEMSLSAYLINRFRGHGGYVALPIFLSRTFRHRAIYVRAESGIVKPEDLLGRRVGVPEYHMTAALWVRGLLQDEFAVRAADIHWITGGLEQPNRREKIELKLPPEIKVTPIAEGETLRQLALEGRIDAIVSAREPSLSGREMVSLFPQPRPMEEDFFRRTGVFPIMHLVVVRRSLLAERPWLAQSLYKAFSQAKHKAISALADRGVLEATLPWLHDELARTNALMGEDFWPYGIERNRVALDTAIRHSREQGLIDGHMSVEALFSSGSEFSVAI